MILSPPQYTLIWVTPFTGVWIEILLYHLYTSVVAVTPFTGVWIEIRTRPGGVGP